MILYVFTTLFSLIIIAFIVNKFLDWQAIQYIRRKNGYSDVEEIWRLKEEIKELNKRIIELVKEVDTYRYNKELLFPIDELLNDINQIKKNLEYRKKTSIGRK